MKTTMMNGREFLRGVECAVAFAVAVALPGSLRAAEPLRYNRDIRPILSDNCFACHGPDKNKRDSGLRLDIREQATKPAESGDTAIVPGKPEASQLIARISTEDRDEQMPPPKLHKKLTASQKELIKRWIAQGRRLYPRSTISHWSSRIQSTVSSSRVWRRQNFPSRRRRKKQH